jgi:hypothetical protein
VALVRERTIQAERRPLVGEVSANSLADNGCHVVSVTDIYGRILDFLDRILQTLHKTNCLSLVVEHISHKSDENGEIPGVSEFISLNRKMLTASKSFKIVASTFKSLVLDYF